MSDDTLRFTATIDLQAAADKKPRIAIDAYAGGLMQVPGFGDVVVDLAGMTIPERVTFLADHENLVASVVGQGQAAVIGGKLVASGTLSEATEAGRMILGLARDGIGLQASIGAKKLDGRFIRAGENIQANGQTIKAGDRGFLHVTKSRLLEVTVTPIAADTSTSVSIAASQKGTVNMSNEITTEEKTRRDTIRATCKDHPDIAAKAVDEGWTPEQAELETLRAQKATWDLETLRASRPQISPALSSKGGPPDNDVLQAAVLLHCGFEALAEKTLGEKAAQAGRDLRCRSLLDIFERGCAAVGYAPKNTNDVIRAAFSTASLSGILGDSANKTLLGAYQAFPSVARRIAKKLSAKNFHDHTGYRLTGDSRLQEVAENGELQYESLNEDSFTYSVATYGRMFGITRQQIINDDLNAFAEIPAMLGRGAALRLEDLFWTLVLANTGSFFSAGNNNYISGATTNLSSTSLGVAIQTLMDQTDSDGLPIAISPKFLVVPSSLKQTADELFVSANIVAGGGNTDDRLPAANVHGGKYEPLATPYLNNASYTGYSALAWYLFGDPADVAAFGIAYLNGQERPIVEEVDQPANLLGRQWRGYIDFGVCQIDHRGAVKSKGAA